MKHDMDGVIRDLTGVIEGDLAAAYADLWDVRQREHRATEAVRKLSKVLGPFVIRRFRKAFRGLLSPKKPKPHIYLDYWNTGHVISWGKDPKANPWVHVTVTVFGLSPAQNGAKVECRMVPTCAADVGALADQMRAAVDAMIGKAHA